MSDTTVNTLIVAAGAFGGAVLGNVVRPLLDHFLKGRTDSGTRAMDITRAQFDDLYRPLYDLFENRIVPDEGIESLDEKDAKDFIALVRKHLHLADPRLEQALGNVEFLLYTASAVDHTALAQAHKHVVRKYNALRKRLHMPYEGLQWRFLRWARSIRSAVQIRWWKFKASRSAAPKRVPK